MNNKLINIVFLLALLFLTRNVFAANPFITDDPDSLTQNTGELYLLSAYNKVNRNTAIAFPAVELDYGITNDIEFDSTLSYLFNYPHTAGVRNTSGMADTQLEIKIRFIHETESRPQIAFAPVYYVPTGNVNRNLGNGRPWLQLPLWLQKSWGPWKTYGGGGYAINSTPATKNFFFGGCVLQKDLNEKWTLGGEIYSSGAAAQNFKAYTLLNLGGYYRASKDIDLLFSIGQSFLGQKNKIASFAVNWNS